MPEGGIYLVPVMKRILHSDDWFELLLIPSKKWLKKPPDLSLFQVKLLLIGHINVTASTAVFTDFTF